MLPTQEEIFLGWDIPKSQGGTWTQINGRSLALGWVEGEGSQWATQGPEEVGLGVFPQCVGNTKCWEISLVAKTWWSPVAVAGQPVLP